MIRFSRHVLCLGLLPLALSAHAGPSGAAWIAPSTHTQTTTSDLQNRLQPFLTASDALLLYQATKAKSWLEYASHQTTEGGLTAAHRQALAEAQRLIEALEQQQNLTLTTPILPVSSVMRRDLWVTAELLKQHPAFAQGIAPLVAQAEVKLVWAAAEHCELGWRHSREHFAVAERLLQTAKATAQGMPNAPDWPESVSYPSLLELNGPQKGCHGVLAHWPLAVPAWNAPEVQTPPPPQSEPCVTPVAANESVPENLLRLPNNVHFALDKSDLSAKSRAVLDQIVAVLVTSQDITVTLYGFTDARASVAYNQALSARRANSVERYLVEHGVALSRIARVAKGETDLKTDDQVLMGHALSRRVELVFAADGKEVPSTAQTADVQLEK